MPGIVNPVGMEMEIQREFAVAAAQVWNVVGEQFGDLSWSTGITRSSLHGELGVGAVRHCEFPPNMFSRDGVVRERLLSFDRDAMSLSYEAGPTGPIKRAVNRWTVVAMGPRACRIDMRATIELRGVMRLFSGLMRPMLRGMGTQTLDELGAEVLRQRQVASTAAQQGGRPAR